MICCYPFFLVKRISINIYTDLLFSWVKHLYRSFTKKDIYTDPNRCKIDMRVDNHMTLDIMFVFIEKQKLTESTNHF